MPAKDWVSHLTRGIHSQQVWLFLLWGGCLAFYGLGYRVQWRQFVEARASMAPLSERIKQHTALIEENPNAEQELAGLHKRFQQIKETGLGKEAIPKAIQQLAQAAAATDVTLETIGPRDDLKAPPGRLPPGVGKRLIEVRLRCTYQALGEFLMKLEDLPSRYTVDKLVIRNNPKELLGSIQVELLLGTYGLL